MFICTTTGCISDDDPEGPSIAIGDKLPEFSVTLNNGEEISTGSLYGKVSVIVFFNTGCSDCRNELPVIQQLWESFKDNPQVAIVLIAREENETEIEEYWKANGLTMPYSPQDTREIYNLFAPSVIPRIYVADRKGIIIAAYGDTDMPSHTILEEIIKSCL